MVRTLSFVSRFRPSPYFWSPALFPTESAKISSVDSRNNNFFLFFSLRSSESPPTGPNAATAWLTGARDSRPTQLWFMMLLGGRSLIAACSLIACLLFVIKNCLPVPTCAAAVYFGRRFCSQTRKWRRWHLTAVYKPTARWFGLANSWMKK